MSKLPVAVSMGDPCGIGPDILLAAWLRRDELGLPPFLVTGDPGFLGRRAELLGMKVEISTQLESNLPNQNKALSVVEVASDVVGQPGKPEPEDAKATIAAIEKAVELVSVGQACAVTTCPINKNTLYGSGFTHPGHTEFLAELAVQHFGGDYLPVMMLAGPQLRTIPVTIHIPLAEVSRSLSRDSIVETVRIANSALKSRFGITSPRIAVAGLNPHAGEQGDIGREEIETIVPALEILSQEGVGVTGPLPADTMFHAAAREKYDCAICMYHDQALIPAKMLGFDDAVNVTLGLPFVRTSPDHGTAYDIAGIGKASLSSFVASLKMAAEMASRK